MSSTLEALAINSLQHILTQGTKCTKFVVYASVDCIEGLERTNGFIRILKFHHTTNCLVSTSIVCTGLPWHSLPSVKHPCQKQTWSTCFRLVPKLLFPLMLHWVANCNWIFRMFGLLWFKFTHRFSKRIYWLHRNCQHLYLRPVFSSYVGFSLFEADC